MNTTIATVNNTVVVKINLGVIALVASSVTMGAAWGVGVIVLEVALSMSAAIMTVIIMEIMITVIGFVEMIVTVIVVIVMGIMMGIVVMIILLSVRIFVGEVVSTAVRGFSVEAVDVIELIELS